LPALSFVKHPRKRHKLHFGFKTTEEQHEPSKVKITTVTLKCVMAVAAVSLRSAKSGRGLGAGQKLQRGIQAGRQVT
jgi:hypothetical protein